MITNSSVNFNLTLFNTITPSSYFTNSMQWTILINFAVLIFFIGISWVLLNWKNFLITLLCIELMYLGIVLAFTFVGMAFNEPKGQLYALSFVILAASESAIGLGILIVLYRTGHSIAFKDYQEIKG